MVARAAGAAVPGAAARIGMRLGAGLGMMEAREVPGVVGEVAREVAGKCELGSAQFINAVYENPVVREQKFRGPGKVTSPNPKKLAIKY